MVAGVVAVSANACLHPVCSMDGVAVTTTEGLGCKISHLPSRASTRFRPFSSLLLLPPLWNSNEMGELLTDSCCWHPCNAMHCAGGGVGCPLPLFAFAFVFS